MNIYIPDKLKTRMDSLPAEDKPNWSALAVRAFESHLAELATKRKDRDMASVIDRLRASAHKQEDADTAAGRKAGREWAKTTAEAAELKRLADARDPVHDWYLFEASSAYGSSGMLYFAITGTADEPDRHAAESFWEWWSDTNNPEAGFVQGFGEGALEVWDQVADQL